MLPVLAKIQNPAFASLLDFSQDLIFARAASHKLCVGSNLFLESSLQKE